LNMIRRKSVIKRGSQNVFADIGSADADSHLLKAGLVSRIQDAIDDRGLTQVEAAKLMSIGQPDVSRILNGNFRDVSVERLMRFLRSLGYEIDIVVREPGNSAAVQTIRLQREPA
jgi:predicted XRE-type DNA-binding protein